MNQGASAPVSKMPTIYMSHFLHGTKVATMEQEAVYDESKGWVRYTPSAQPVENIEVPVNQLDVKRKYTRRPISEASEGA